MGVTLDLDELLLNRVRARAAAHGLTVDTFVERALREYLAPAGGTSPIELPAWDGGGLPEGVDWDNNESVLAWLEAFDAQQGGRERLKLPAGPLMFPAGLDLSDNSALLDYLDALDPDGIAKA